MKMIALAFMALALVLTSAPQFTLAEEKAIAQPATVARKTPADARTQQPTTDAFLRDLDKALAGGCGAFQWYVGWEEGNPPTVACRGTLAPADPRTRAIVDNGGT